MAAEALLSTLAQRAFISTIALQVIIAITMVAFTFGIVEAYLGDIFHQPAYKTLSCYLSLFVLAGTFEIIMAFDALWSRNIIQLLGIILFQAALIVFSALQVYETRAALWHNNVGWLWHKVEPFLMVVPCVVAASWLFLIFWVKRLYREFEWSICDAVKRDLTLRFMYLFYQVFICLLKFDFFCFVGVIMQLLIAVIVTDSTEFKLTVAALPVAVCFIAGCAYAAKYEIKWMMSVALVLMVPCMIFCYKLVRIYLPYSEGEYITTRTTLTFFTVIALLLLLVTFWAGVKCLRDFNKGLLPPKTRDVNQTYSSLPRWQTFE